VNDPVGEYLQPLGTMQVIRERAGGVEQIVPELVSIVAS